MLQLISIVEKPVLLSMTALEVYIVTFAKFLSTFSTGPFIVS